MKSIELRIISCGILLLISIISGIWLSKLGRPLNTAVFTIHKLISILVIILMVVVIYNYQKTITIEKTEWIFIIITGFIFLITVLTGALLSFDKPVNNIILTLHRISSILVIVSSILTIYIIFSKSS